MFCSPAAPWFEQLKVQLDLGFQGFADFYKRVEGFLPFKKRRVAKGQSNQLNDEQKRINKQQVSQRIAVEHSIGGMKRYRTHCNRLRMKTTACMDTITGVCAGL